MFEILKLESDLMKKLSIITICLNEPNVEKTCESIVKQTWRDFEWIVIDGGSNADTLAIFEKYKGRIDKFISEPDEGIYDACNKGIKLASDEFVEWLLLLSEQFERYCQNFEKDELSLTFFNPNLAIIPSVLSK